MSVEKIIALLEDGEAEFVSLVSRGANRRSVKVFKRDKTENGVIPHREFPVVDLKWDPVAANERVRAWASGSEKDSIDPMKYRLAFGKFDDKAPENVDACSFLHHDIQNGRLVTNKNGVSSAIEAVKESNLTEEDKARLLKHLEAHLKEPVTTMLIKDEKEAVVALQAGKDAPVVVPIQEVKAEEVTTADVEKSIGGWISGIIGRVINSKKAAVSEKGVTDFNTAVAMGEFQDEFYEYYYLLDRVIYDILYSDMISGGEKASRIGEAFDQCRDIVVALLQSPGGVEKTQKSMATEKKDPVSKVGRRMSSERTKRLGEAIEILNGIVMDASSGAQEGNPTNKEEDEMSKELKEAVERLSGEVNGLKEMVNAASVKTATAEDAAKTAGDEAKKAADAAKEATAKADDAAKGKDEATAKAEEAARKAVTDAEAIARETATKVATEAAQKAANDAIATAMVPFQAIVDKIGASLEAAKAVVDKIEERVLAIEATPIGGGVAGDLANDKDKTDKGVKGGMWDNLIPIRKAAVPD